MDDLSSKLAEIMNDPESMNRVRKMAEGLLAEKDDSKSESSDFDSSMFDGVDIEKVMQIVSLLKSRSDDSRTKLLLALKPNLSSKRQEKVDNAIKLLKLIEILPALKQSGLLDF